MVTLQFKRGPEASIPSLSSGEPGVTTDTEKLFVGMPSGNTEMAKQTDLSALSDTVTEINESYISNSQINVSGGVAGLGENGALAIAQGGTGGTTVTQALVNLGAASQADLSDLTARVTEAESKLTVLWDAVFTNITGNPFTVVLSSLDGITVTAGVWNAAKSRLEC